MASWTSLHQWLYDKKGILSDEQHLLNRYMGAEGSFDAYKNAVRNGTNIHDLESAVTKYKAAVTQLGFSDEYITEIGEGVYQIIFRPTNKKIKINDADCPSLIISATDDNGISVSHNLPTMNLPVWVMGQDGTAGLTSAIAAGIDQATSEIRAQAGRLGGIRDIKKLANSLKYYTNKAITGVTHNNPAITTKSQSDAYKKAVQIGDIGELRAEAIAAMSGQTLTAFYNRSLYNANQGKMYGSGAPKSEKQFHQWLEEIRNGSRNYTTVKQLGDYIHRRFPWIYNNIWKGQLENMYETVYKIGQHQGTRKEGSPGIISLWDVDTPFASMAPAASNKPGKALRSYQKRATGAHHKAGTNYTMTKRQSGLYKKGQEYPLYYMGTVTDDDIFAAAQELGLPLDSLKGTMADSSVYASSILKDFQMDVIHAQKVNAGIVKHRLRGLVQERLSKKGITDAARMEAEITKYLNDEKNSAWIDKMTRSILAKELGVGVSKSSNPNTYLGSGKPTYDATTGKYLVDVVEALRNPTFTTRSGATGDFRSVSSVMNDQLLGKAFEHHGYTARQIYKNGKDYTGGLKMTVGVGGSEIEAKNIWSYLDRVYNYITAEMLGGNDPTSKTKGNAAIVKKLTAGVPFLNGALSYDAGTGRILMDNDMIRKNIGNAKITGGKKGSAFGALQQLVKFAQDAGIYESGEYFRDIGGGKFELAKPLVMGSEMGVFSGYRYQGVGDESDSRMKLDRRGLLSMQETLGRMRMRHPDRLKELEPMEKMVAGYQAQFDEMQAEYRIYQKSLDYLSKTFSGDTETIRKDLTDKGLLITADQLAGLSTDIGYDTNKIFSEDGADLAIAKIKKLAEARYQKLLKEQGKEALEKKGIFSARDLQIGLDTGDRRFVYDDQFGSHLGGIMMLSGMGELTEAESYDPETGLPRAFSYVADDISKANNSIVRAYLDFMGADHDDYAAARRAGHGAAGGIQDIRRAVLNGSIFEKYNKIVMPEGGYLLQHAMNTNAEAILKKKAEEMRAGGRKISDEFTGAKYMMHPEDAMAILNAYEMVDGKKVYQQSDDELRKRYSELYKVSKKSLKGKSRDDLVNGIIDALTLENDNFKGVLDNGNMFWRSPTLKMYDDILGGGLLLSNSLVSKGNLLADPDMVAAFKGDFDGDRIAVFNALQEGDLATANKLMTDYFGAISKAQRGARKPGSNEINVAEIDKILSIADQLGLASAANAGYKGSGVYGNLLFGLAGGLQDAGLGFATATGSNLGGALSSHMALNLAGALYQEGINIKNVKSRGKRGHNSEEDLNKLMGMATSGATWNSLDAMLTMLNHMEKLGMTGKTGTFKDNVMANLGMSFGDMTDAEWEYYAKMAEQAAGDAGLKSHKKKLLEEAAAFRGKTAKNFSNELAAYIITSKNQGGLNYYLGKNGSSIGDILRHMYEFIGGHDANPELVTSRKYDNSTDETTKKLIETWGDKIRKQHGAMAQRANVSFEDWMMDPNSSWAARRLEFIAGEKGKTVWANPHQVNDYLFGPYADKKGRVPDNLQGILAAGRQGLIEGKKLEELGLAPDDIATFKTSTIATMRGSLIHTYMEIFGDALKATKVSPEELTKDFTENPVFKKGVEDFTKVLYGLGYSTLEASFEVQNAYARAQGLQGMLGQNLFAAKKTKGGKVKTEKIGSILGTEIVMPGQVGNFKTTGVADVALSQIDEDGKRTLRIGDYKNTPEGRLTINDLMQTAQYLDFLRTWKEDIVASGATDADVYFKSSGSPFVKRIQESIRHQAEQEAKRNPAFNQEKFYQEQMAQYYKLFEDVRLADNFMGSIFASSGASGAIRQYDFNLENPALRGALNMAHAGRAITPDIQNYLLSTAPRVKYESGVTLGNAGAFDEYLTQLDKQLELENKIALLKDKAAKQGKEEKAVTDQEIAGLQQELEKMQQLVEEKRKLVTIGGETYSGYDASRPTTDVFHDYNEAERKLREDLSNQLQIARDAVAYKEKVSSEQDMLKEYGEIMKNQWSTMAEIRKVDRELSVEERLNPEDVSLIKKEKEGLDNFLRSLQEAAERIKIYFKGTEGAPSEATSEGQGQFEKLVESLTLMAARNSRAERLAGESDAAYKLRTEHADMSTVASAYRTRDNTRYKVWETDQRLQTETDDLTREFLEIQKQSLQEMLIIAENELERLKASHTDEKTGQMNDYWKKVFGDAEYRSALELQAKEAGFMAKKNATSATGGGGFFGGIDAQLALYFKRMMGGGIIMRLLSKFRQEISKIIQQAKELDKVMTNVRIVTNGTASETRNLMQQYSDLGKSLGATTKEVAQAGIEWMRQGYSAAETTKLITASLYLSKLGMIDSTQATKNLTSALKGFKMEASEAMSVVDKLTAIDLKAATSAGDIAEGLAQFANLGSLAGVDIDQAAAYVATIADVTQMSGSSAGQALKTIISRYGNVKAGAYNKLNTESESGDTDEKLNDVEKVLSKIGISIRKTNLQFKDFDEVLAEIADKWDTLDNVSKKAIANAFAGIRQQESFVTLLENWDKYESLLATSRNSKGTAETKYNAYRDSLEASQNRLTATIEEFVNRAEISNLLKVLTDIATSLAKGLPFLIKWLPIIFTQLQNLKILSGKSLIQKALTSDRFINFVGGIGEDASYSYNAARARGHGRFRSALSGVFGGLFGHQDARGRRVHGFMRKDPETGEWVREENPAGGPLTPRDHVRLGDEEGLNYLRQAETEGLLARRGALFTRLRGFRAHHRANRLEEVLSPDEVEARYVAELNDLRAKTGRFRDPRIRKEYEHTSRDYHRFRIRRKEREGANLNEVADEYQAMGGRRNIRKADSLRRRQKKNEEREAAKLAKQKAAAEAKIQKSYFKEELKNKKTLYELSEKGKTLEEGILNKRKLGEAVAAGVLKKDEAREMLSTQMVSDAQIEKLHKAGILSDAEAEAMKKHEVVAQAEAEARAGAGTATGTPVKGGGKAPKGKINMGNVQAGFSMAAAGASYAVNQITAGVSAYNTAGVSHKNDWDEEVQSSKEAHEAGRATVMAWTMAVPFVGSMIGEAIASETMKNMDRARDSYNKTASDANDSLEALNNVSGELETMANLASSNDPADIKEREEAARSYARELYKPENSETRQMLQTYLGQLVNQGDESLKNQYSLNDLMKDYTSEDKNTRERAVRLLQIAQKKAELQQKEAARAAEQYQWEQRLGDAKLKYNAANSSEYTARGISHGAEAGAVGAGVGAGIGTGLGVAAGTMGAVALGALAIGGSVPVVGWIVGGVVAAIAGIASGIMAGIAEAEAKRAEAEAKERAEREWNSKSTQQQINSLNGRSAQIKDAIDYAEMNEEERQAWREANGDKSEEYLAQVANMSEQGVDTLSEQLNATEEFIDVLYDYKSYLQEIIDERNELKAEEALLEAKDKNDTYLTDLSVEQLKDLNLTDIYRMMAEAVGENGLAGIDTYQKVLNPETHLWENKVDENGNPVLTTAFIEAVTKTLRTDSDIAAVLNGEAYTLAEAIQKLSVEDPLEQKILQNFATALGTTVDNLDNYVAQYGSLKLSELLQTTTEINTEISEYAALMGDITNASGSISEWMAKITKQFPDLIAYMGDIPTLMNKIMTKIKQLSDQYLQTQWGELATSDEFFQDEDRGIRKDILSNITATYGSGKSDEINALMKKEGITNMAALRRWLAGQDLGSNENAKILYEAFEKAGSSYMVTSDVYKEALSQYIDYQTSLLDKQIDNLTAQRSALEEINKQREYENRLIEAKIALENAQNEKKRVYRAGVGWVYEADQGAIEQAQKGLEEVENEQDISKLTMQIETLSSYKDDWSNIWEKQNFELAEQQAKAFEEQFNVKGGLQDGFDGLNSTMGSVFMAIGKLQEGIETPLSDITAKILEGDEDQKAKTIQNLQNLWDTYQQALESGDTKAADEALKAYTSAYAAAGDTVANWTPQSNGLVNNGAATAANQEAAKNNPEDKGSYGDNAVTVGQGGYDKYHDPGKLGWRLTDNGKTYTLSNYQEGNAVSSDNANSIMTDIGRAQDTGNSNTGDNDAHVWWKTSGGAFGDAAYGNTSKLPAPLKKQKTDTSLIAYAKRVNETYPEVVVGGLYGGHEWAYLKNGGAWNINEINDPGNSKGDVWYDALAQGTLDAGSGKNGLALINELGTEALVTPEGTLTALPSHTGVVPADITRNLWALGGVAPGILRALQMNILPNGVGGAQPAMVDESFTVNGLTMNVNADSTFDAKKFVDSLKQQMALRRNLK